MEISKTPDPIDVHVGGRIRARRIIMGITQQQMAAQLGITFQQVQKYETGKNRVGASRISQIAAILCVAPSYLFESMGTSSKTVIACQSVPRNATQDPELTIFLGSKEALSLNRGYLNIRSPKLRRQIMELVETLASEFE